MGNVSNERCQVYPSPEARRWLGADVDGEIATVLNRALEVWAAEIADATRDNETALPRAAWNFLADVMNGFMTTPGIDPYTQIIANAEDAQRLDATGDKWFGRRKGDAGVRDLVTTIRSMDRLHAWAVLWTCLWFWDHHAGINTARDEWWTLAARRAKS